ncbi:MAG: metallophosphoesterase family protein [Thermoplasmata archaeon]
MKILALADLHSQVSYFYIEELISQHHPDLITILGDITDFGPSESASDLFMLNSTVILTIPGNCDPPAILKMMNCYNVINMHKNVFYFKGYRFVGFGGADISTINIGIAFTDLEAYDYLSNNLTEDSILLLHQPPYGFLDTLIKDRSRHVGNKGVRAAIDKITPRLILVGHMHENQGILNDGNTVIVNPGAAKDRKYALVDLEKEISVKLFSED